MKLHVEDGFNTGKKRLFETLLKNGRNIVTLFKQRLILSRNSLKQKENEEISMTPSIGVGVKRLLRVTSFLPQTFSCRYSHIKPGGFLLIR